MDSPTFKKKIDLTQAPDESCLQANEFFDSDHPSIIAYAEALTKGVKGDAEKAAKLYYAVRDEIIYAPYHCLLPRAKFRASAILQDKKGYCVPKSLLLGALARAVGIPAALGLADVKNHLATEKMAQLTGDSPYFHGYTVFYIENKWVKASPAFNLSMCERFDVKPLEFNGRDDALMHEFDRQNRRHMEYLKDHGVFSEFPYELSERVLWERFPALMDSLKKNQTGDFENEKIA